MKKRLALIYCLLLVSCAVLRGQAKYTGIESEPTVKETIVHISGLRTGMTNYWALPVEKTGTIQNPLDGTINAHIYCYASFPETFDISVPPHTSQNFLFITNTQYMYEKLCSITGYSVQEIK